LLFYKPLKKGRVLLLLAMAFQYYLSCYFLFFISGDKCNVIHPFFYYCALQN
jgi:hypothetical protein